MVEMKTGTHDRGTTFFPLYRYESLLGGKAEQVHNFASEFVKEWSETTHTQFVQTGHGDGNKTTGPEDVLFWLYGLFHSPEYRRRYRAALSQRFPIVLLTSNLDLLRRLARLGGELVALHLLESPKLDHPITEFIGGKNPEVEKPSWSENTVWVDKAQTIGFKGVREEVWNFHIGGYQVCAKWLKDRKGRTLSKDDIAHYQKVVIALSETIRLMAEIDQVIETHGGWPGAFASAGQDADATTDAATIEQTSIEKTIAPPPALVAKKSRAEPMPDLFSTAPPAKAHSEPATPTARPANIEDYDRDELCAEIRRLFNDGAVRERDASIVELARRLGYHRTGSTIRETLNNALITAVRRGILQNEHDQLSLLCRNIEQYERDFLKNQFIASLGGRTWFARDDAIRAFARWLGFARTGSNIEDAARSLINGLLREGRLESDGANIRRI
jgi:hypothetical protein